MGRLLERNRRRVKDWRGGSEKRKVVSSGEENSGGVRLVAPVVMGVEKDGGDDKV